jgi:hypothetical protein
VSRTVWNFGDDPGVRVLADDGAVDAAQVAAATERYEIDTEAEPPWRR